MSTDSLDKIIIRYFPKAKLLTKQESFTYTKIIHFKANRLNLVAKLISDDVLSKYPNKKRLNLFKELCDTTDKYFLILKKIGINVPNFHKLIVDQQKLVEFATDLGKNRLDIILKTAPTKQIPYIMDIYIKSILPAITQKRLTIGFDATAENLFLSKNNKFIYCDFVPARMKYKGEYLVGFPQPANKKEVMKSYGRYYLPYGILRRARIFLLNTNPDLDAVFFKTLEKNLSSIQFRKIKSQFDKSDEFKIKNLILNNEIAKAEKEILKINDPDTLREVSAWVYWLRKKTTVPLEVYDLTRIKFYLSKTERNNLLNQFKQTIIRAMRVDKSI